LFRTQLIGWINKFAGARWTCLIVCFVLFAFPRFLAAEQTVVSIAAASDLVFCLEELDSEFRKEHPEVELKVSTGSSGNFFAQIKNGAPFDLFLSADISYPRALAEMKKAAPETLFNYAVGRLVLWSMHTNIDWSKGLVTLQGSEIRKFAIANPEHAPYGAAARAALQKAGLWESLQPKLVLGENIAQTAQFIQTANVDAGLVALSLVAAPKMKGQGTWWLVPQSEHPRLDQAAVLTLRGAQNTAAIAYLKFMRGTKARSIFDRYGFQAPAGTK
jgi:molybdate transport system substrate-binding protein